MPVPLPLGPKVSCHLQWRKALPIRSCRCFCGQPALTLALSIGSGSFRCVECAGDLGPPDGMSWKLKAGRDAEFGGKKCVSVWANEIRLKAG